MGHANRHARGVTYFRDFRVFFVPIAVQALADHLTGETRLIRWDSENVREFGDEDELSHSPRVSGDGRG